MMCRWRRGELVVPGEKPAKEFSLERLGVGGNYVWCLTIAVIFMELGGAKNLGGFWGFKFIIWGRASYKKEGAFVGGENSSSWHNRSE